MRMGAWFLQPYVYVGHGNCMQYLEKLKDVPVCSTIENDSFLRGTE